MKVRRDTAKRTIGTIAYHNGDLAAARHDVQIGLNSLGSMTDYKSERVRDVLDWILARPDERRPVLLATLQRIADGEPVHGG